MEEYKKFLGISNLQEKKDIDVYQTNNREILLSGKFYYPVIIVKSNNKIIISCSSMYDFKKYMKGKEYIYEDLMKFSQNNFRKYEIKEMYRLYKIKENLKINCNEVELLNETVKMNFFNIVKRKQDIEYKNEKWEEFNNVKAPYRN